MTPDQMIDSLRTEVRVLQQQLTSTNDQTTREALTKQLQEAQAKLNKTMTLFG